VRVVAPSEARLLGTTVHQEYRGEGQKLGDITIAGVVQLLSNFIYCLGKRLIMTALVGAALGEMQATWGAGQEVTYGRCFSCTLDAAQPARSYFMFQLNKTFKKTMQC
jgi:hypothetical protein